MNAEKILTKLVNYYFQSPWLRRVVRLSCHQYYGSLPQPVLTGSTQEEFNFESYKIQVYYPDLKLIPDPGCDEFSWFAVGVGRNQCYPDTNGAGPNLIFNHRGRQIGLGGLILKLWKIAESIGFQHQTFRTKVLMTLRNEVFPCYDVKTCSKSQNGGCQNCHKYFVFHAGFYGLKFSGNQSGEVDKILYLCGMDLSLTRNKSPLLKMENCFTCKSEVCDFSCLSLHFENG